MRGKSFAIFAEGSSTWALSDREDPYRHPSLTAVAGSIREDDGPDPWVWLHCVEIGNDEEREYRLVMINWDDLYSLVQVMRARYGKPDPDIDRKVEESIERREQERNS